MCCQCPSNAEALSHTWLTYHHRRVPLPHHKSQAVPPYLKPYPVTLSRPSLKTNTSRASPLTSPWHSAPSRTQAGSSITELHGTRSEKHLVPKWLFILLSAAHSSSDDVTVLWHFSYSGANEAWCKRCTVGLGAFPLIVSEIEVIFWFNYPFHSFKVNQLKLQVLYDSGL